MSARTIELHGRSFSYRQVGAGPVVVLVHGLAGTMGTWDAVVDELATRCTVVAVDLPGHGHSEPLPGDSSIGTYANALRDLLDALGHPPATVVGHSLGEASRCSSRTSIRNAASGLSRCPAAGSAPRPTP
jgi:pimeloyl-ACP methyl ester carboxylesterase